VTRAPREAPPAWIERRLEAAVGSRRSRRAIVGDLAEIYAARRAARISFTRLWYAGEALRLALRFGPRTLGRALVDRLDPSTPPPEKNRMSPFAFDLRLSMRSLAKRPTSAVIMILTLAAGLAANAAIYGLLDALVLHPYDFPEVDRIVSLQETSPQEDFSAQNLSPATFLDLRQASGEIVESLVGFRGWSTALRGSEVPVQLRGYHVSPEFFEALGVRPSRGRGFLAGEETSDGPPPAVVGYDVWREQFGGRDDVLGSTVELDGVAHTVVGVAPEEFVFPGAAEIWAPLAFAPEDAIRRDQHYVGAFGRLRKGVSLGDARARWTHFGAQLAERYPETNRGRGLATLTLVEGMRDVGLKPILTLWQVAAFFVLFIGWLNVANLVLARGAERQHELALLDALGAGRMRLVRLQITESAQVALAAAALSLPMTWMALRLLRDNIPQRIRGFVAGWSSIGFSLDQLPYTVGLALVSVLAVATWPALRISGRRLANVLRDGGRAGSPGGGRSRGRALLVVGEISAALVLVIVAAVAVRGASALIDGDLGFSRERLLTFKVDLDESRYPTPESRRTLVRSAVDRLAALPGAERVAVSNVLPSTGSGSRSRPIAVEGEAEPDRANPPTADLRTVSPEYFATLELPVLEGRGLRESDDETTLPVALVSRSMAERFWPGVDPIGRRFRAGDADESWLTVVGIAGDHVHDWFARRNYPTYFVPYRQASGSYVSFLVKTAGEPDGWRQQVRSTIAAIDPYQPIFDLMSLKQAVYDRTVGLRYISTVLSVMAGMALLLALSGVYAVMAYSVSLRRREIGVRVALGASGSDVLRATLGRSLRLTAIGLTLGLAGGIALSRLLRSAMRGAMDLPLSLLVAGVALLALTAVVAAVVPARRALALDPSQVLRSE